MLYVCKSVKLDGMGVESFAAWCPKKQQLESRQFRHGRVGACLVGPRLRRGRWGEVRLGIHQEVDEVVEIEFYDALPAVRCDLRPKRLRHAEDLLLAELQPWFYLEHAMLPRMIASGVDEDVPYVVRPHVLGCSLFDVLNRVVPVPRQTADNLLSKLEDFAEFLHGEGENASSFAWGGFDPREIWLSFDGRVALHGAGLAYLRTDAFDPVEADWFSIFMLKQRFLAHRDRVVSDDPEPVAACSEQQLGLWLRRVCAESVDEQRAFFGLAALH